MGVKAKKNRSFFLPNFLFINFLFFSRATPGLSATYLFKKFFSYIYMLAIAIQTAGPNGLKFLEKPVSTSGVAKAKKDFIKKSILFFQKSIFFVLHSI